MKIASHVVGLLALALVMASVAPAPVLAIDVVKVIGEVKVKDNYNLKKNAETAAATSRDIFKENTEDPLAWKIARIAIQSLTKSTVNWINSGFDGSPAFVTDLNQTMLNVGDAAADQFFNELQSNSAIDSPFRDAATQALRDNYYRSSGNGAFGNQNAFTLNQSSPNPSAFINGDFSQGGWNAWFSLTANKQNNPIGFIDEAQRAQQGMVGVAQSNRQTELGWGNGFSSLKDSCGSTALGQAVSLANKNRECVGALIQTPGAIIKDSLVKQLGAGTDSLVSADEISEVIDALFGELVNQVLGPGGGLRGVSQPAAGGGRSYIDAATTQTPVDANAQNSFIQTLNNQRSQVEQYQQNWQGIRDAGEGAAQACADRGRDDVVNDTINPIMERASVALGKAASAITSLDGIRARAQSVTVLNQVQSLYALSSEYNALVSNNSFPTASEMAEVQYENTDAADETLMSRLQAAENECSPSINS
jgi:hypothetical protein